MKLKEHLQLNNMRSMQIFQLLRFASLLAVSVVFSWFIPKSLIGFYEKLLLIGSSATFFWVSGLINPFIPYYHSLDEKRQKKLIPNIFLILTVLSLLSTVLLLVFVHFKDEWQQKLFYIFLVYNFFNAPVFLTEYIFLVRNKFKTIFWYGFIISVLYIGCLTLPLLWDKSLFTSVITLCVFTILRFSFLTGYISSLYKWLPDRKLSFTFIKRTLPYVLSLIIGGSSIYLDSFVIEYFFSDEDFAIFRYGARELPFVLLLANAFSNVKSGELARAAKKDNFEEALLQLKTGSAKLMHWLFPVTIILLLLSKPLFILAYTETFLPSAGIFNIYLLLIISRLAFPQTILLSLNKNRLLLQTSAAEWAVNITMNLVFVLLFGMKGVAYATVIAFFFEKILLVYYCKKNGIALTKYFPVKTWLLYSAVTIAVFILSLYI